MSQTPQTKKSYGGFIAIFIIIILGFLRWNNQTDSVSQTNNQATTTTTTTQEARTPGFADYQNMIVGKWKNTQNSNVVTDIYKAGRFVERNSNGVSENTRILFSKDHPNKAFTQSYEDGIYYLAVTNFDGTIVTYYKIIQINEDYLNLQSLTDGSSIAYQKTL